MPLFLKHKILFVHIPKCGGDTFSACLAAAGDAPFLFVADGSVMVNGHTPQHVTWRELCQMGWVTPPDFRVVALVRHPVDRVLSAYRYWRRYRPALARLTRTPDDFLKNFFSPKPEVFARFDHHNLAMLDFLRDADGRVAPEIEVWPLQRMDALLASFGLGPVAPHDRRNVTVAEERLGPGQLQRVRERVSEDLEWFERTFPEIRESPQP